MKFDYHQPCTKLKPYIKHYIVSESELSKKYNILPDTNAVIGFQYSGRLGYLADDKEIILSKAGITGLMDNFRTFSNTSNTGTILVIFSEVGAASFFKVPMHEIYGQSISLDCFFGTDAMERVHTQLAGALTDSGRIAIIEQFLLANLSERPADLLVNEAVRVIHQTKGTIRIASLAKRLNTSASPLEKRFRSLTGASPKKFSTIVRIKNVLSSIQNNNTDFASYLAGFYDQAHFIKNFKRFTSVTLGEYLKSMHKESR